MNSLLTITLTTMLCVSVSLSQMWTPLTSGTTNALRHVQFVDVNTGWAVGASNTVLNTTNGGTTWNSQPITTGALWIGCQFLNANLGWVGGDAGVCKTTNGGASWTTLVGPTGITKVFFLNANLGWAVGGVDGSSPVYGDIFKTTDGGTTWTQQHNSSTWSRFYGVQFVDANTGWAYTESNGLLIKTTDGGATWTPQMQYGTSIRIRGMYFADQNTGWVTGYSSSSAVILKTTNGGANWTDYGTGLQYAVTDVRFVNASLGWAAANGGPAGRGVLNTTNGGTTWTFTSLATTALNCLSFLNANAGWGVGEAGAIVKYTNSTDVQELASLPGAFSLSQNYPNPFNPSTEMRFQIPTSAHTTVRVFNVLGREVKTLVDGVLHAGTYVVRFDASELPSGSYFYQLKSGNFVGTKKLSLIR